MIGKPLEEEWRPVKGYEGLYEVSNMGRVKSLYYGKERIMIPMKIITGYKQVEFAKDGIPKRKLVHRLVAEAFLPNPMNLPVVNHLDGDKTNNCVTNLEWCTYQENSSHAIRTGLWNPRGKHNYTKPAGPPGKPIVVYTKTGEFVSFFPSATEAAKILGISRDSIYKATNNKCKHAHGYVCEFAE